MDAVLVSVETAPTNPPFAASVAFPGPKSTWDSSPPILSAVTFPTPSTVSVTLPVPRPTCVLLKLGEVVDTSVVKPGSVVVPGFAKVVKLTKSLVPSPEQPATDRLEAKPASNIIP